MNGASSCPLCGGPNGCAMAAGTADGSACWCTLVSFGAELLASVPASAQGQACICSGCVASQDPGPDRMDEA